MESLVAGVLAVILLGAAWGCFNEAKKKDDGPRHQGAQGLRLLGFGCAVASVVMGVVALIGT